MRTRLITAGILLAMPLTLATSRRASSQEETAAEKACQTVISIVISHAQHEQDPHALAELKFKCEHHPRRGACESMAKFLAQSSPIHALHCADGARTAEPSGLPPVEPKVAAADDACQMFAYAYRVHAEDVNKSQVAQWKVICAHHPLRATCESTVKFIEENRHLHSRVIDRSGPKG
jgi:hypothetical protein